MAKIKSYFKHDINTCDDEKIIRLLIDGKAEGYGVYWMLLEYLSKQPDYTAALDFNMIGYRLRQPANVIQKVVENYGLFEIDEAGKRFFSRRLKGFFEDVDAAIEKSREGGRKSAASRAQDEGEKTTTLASTLSTTLASTLSTNKNKREENKREENIESNPPIAPQGAEGAPKRFSKPTTSEVQAYCDERGNGISGEEFCDFYESKGWKIGKSPMKDWKAAVRTWEKDDKRRLKAVAPQMGPGEFIREDGIRTYGDGKYTVPMDAPRRPGNNYFWNPNHKAWEVM